MIVASKSQHRVVALAALDDVRSVRTNEQVVAAIAEDVLHVGVDVVVLRSRSVVRNVVESHNDGVWVGHALVVGDGVLPFASDEVDGAASGPHSVVTGTHDEVGVRGPDVEGAVVAAAGRDDNGYVQPSPDVVVS